MKLASSHQQLQRIHQRTWYTRVVTFAHFLSREYFVEVTPHDIIRAAHQPLTAQQQQIQPISVSKAYHFSISILIMKLHDYMKDADPDFQGGKQLNCYLEKAIAPNLELY